MRSKCEITKTYVNWPGLEPMRCIPVGWWPSLWQWLRWGRWDREGRHTSTGRNRLYTVESPTCLPGLAWIWQEDSNSYIKYKTQNHICSLQQSHNPFNFSICSRLITAILNLLTLDMFIIDQHKVVHDYEGFNKKNVAEICIQPFKPDFGAVTYTSFGPPLVLHI